MFSKCIRPFIKTLRNPRKLLTATTILAYALYKTTPKLDQPQTRANKKEWVFTQQARQKKLKEKLKDLKSIEVCQGNEIQEGERKVVTLKNDRGTEFNILVFKHQGKFHAFIADCPHREPFQEWRKSSLADAVIFNDKLFCPHHGCVFNIQSGTIEHGPSLYNLPVFFSQEEGGMVKVYYPQELPHAIEPDFMQRDSEDLRKVLILGGDDSAAMGCISSLRQFGYDGEITVVKEGLYHFPYKAEYLHKKMLNLHLNDPLTDEDIKNQIAKDKKKGSQLKKGDLPPSRFKEEKALDQFIEKQLQMRIYDKLKFYKDKWYEDYGISFVFNNDAYRIINKQFYPYVTCSDGTKLEFDTLLLATGTVQQVPNYESITTKQQRALRTSLSENVFCPYREKEEHIRLNKFLNKNVVKSLLVLGYNVESLQFIQQLKQQFPKIKVSVIDSSNQSPIEAAFGPELEKRIVKEYTKNGVDFYLQVQEELLFSNKFSHKNIQKRRIEQKKQKSSNNKKQKQSVDPRLAYLDSVQARISDDLRLKADGVVVFPNTQAGNTLWLKDGKYTDFQFILEDRVSGDTFGKTDNIRIFAAGVGSCNEYFLLNRRLVTNSALMSFEQGYNTGLNMLALRIPLYYVSCDIFKFFGKKLYFVGPHDFYDTVLTIGSLEEWDFLTIYAAGNKVKAVSGSESRAKQIMIMRQAFRVNCVPMFDQFLTGYWTVENLANLIKHLNKSGCYRDIIFANRDNVHQKDLCWMERTPDAGFENDKPQAPSEEFPSQEVGPDGKLRDI